MEILKESLLEHVSQTNAAFFKYQQRDEEELTEHQRKTLAENLLQKSTSMFLNRFGNFMLKEHLEYFNLIKYDNQEKEDMIKAQLKNIIYNMDHKQTIVRNRRYSAMLKMVEEKNSYFSEDEMIRRDPALFEEIVGQYLSSAEKIARRDYDPRTSSLVEILLETIDQKNEVERKENENLNNIESESNSRQDFSDDSSHEEQWGNFDGQKHEKERKRKSNFVSKGEREVLKDEWIGIMYNNFISGKDSEFFDYSQVDDNEVYDETIENDIDCQEKYFDAEDENSKLSSRSESQNQIIQESEEDELDVYMKHIEGHLKRQNQNGFVEEFDEEL